MKHSSKGLHISILTVLMFCFSSCKFRDVKSYTIPFVWIQLYSLSVCVCVCRGLGRGLGVKYVNFCRSSFINEIQHINLPKMKNP